MGSVPVVPRAEEGELYSKKASTSSRSSRLHHHVSQHSSETGSEQCRNRSIRPRCTHDTNTTGVVNIPPDSNGGDPVDVLARSISTASSADIMMRHSRISTATDRVMELRDQLDGGEMPTTDVLKDVLSLALGALLTRERQTGYHSRIQEEMLDDDNPLELEAVGDVEVRKWLTTTFSRSNSVIQSSTPNRRFKSVVRSVLFGCYLKRGTHCPERLTKYFEEHLEAWEFNMLHANTLADRHILRHVGYEIFKKHNLFEKFAIPVTTFTYYLDAIEEGYGNHGNPYHNAVHGADVTQTTDYLIHGTGLDASMTKVEILSIILAAIIHDVDHPGTANFFEIDQCSNLALLYNDISVLENHHLTFAFTLLQQEGLNFLNGLSSEDYKRLRWLMVTTVLNTDMSSHQKQVRVMKARLGDLDDDFVANRDEVYSLLLHLADISHPCKPWNLHYEWSLKLTREFFNLGDRIKELNPKAEIPYPYDRHNTNVPKSQIGFIEYIVKPAFKVCGEMLDRITSAESCAKKIWERYLTENTEKWASMEEGWEMPSEAEEENLSVSTVGSQCTLNGLSNGTHETCSSAAAASSQDGFVGKSRLNSQPSRKVCWDSDSNAH